MSTKQGDNSIHPLVYLCISILFLAIPFIASQLNPAPCTDYLCINRLPFFLFQLFLPLVSISPSIVFMIKLIIALIKKSDKSANQKQNKKGTIFLSIAKTTLDVLAISWIVTIIAMASNSAYSEAWLGALAFVTPFVILISIIFAITHIIILAVINGIKTD